MSPFAFLPPLAIFGNSFHFPGNLSDRDVFGLCALLLSFFLYLYLEISATRNLGLEVSYSNVIYLSGCMQLSVEAF